MDFKEEPSSINLKTISLNEFTPYKKLGAFRRDWYEKNQKITTYIDLQNPIIAFLNADRKFGFICSHICIFLARLSGRESIDAFVVKEFTDWVVMQIIIKSHPTQQPFKKWVGIISFSRLFGKGAL